MTPGERKPIHLNPATRTRSAVSDQRGEIVDDLITLPEHDPEKWAPVFSRDKREAFARRSCPNRDEIMIRFKPNRIMI
jgi:hypothetical protein